MHHPVLSFSVSCLALLIISCGWSAEPLEGPGVPAQLEATVRLFSEDFSPRSYVDVKNLELAASFIEKSFEQSHAKVEIQRFTVRGIVYKNIRAIYGNPEAPRWIVGAHYDAHKGTPGADDNASGVAGLIELAHRLGEMPTPPSVEVVAYCLEEPPFFGSEQMGSYVHAKSLKENKTPVVGMLSLEMIGYFSDRKNSQHYPLPSLAKVYPDRGNFIAVISRMDQVAFTRQVHSAMQAGTDLPVEYLNGPEQIPGIDFSDHRNYWTFGYPAVMITDTAFMRNQEYHRKGDTADRLDYPRMAKVIDAVFHLLTRP
ncbi:M28 family peptidase [Kiritimatiellota bacterium B12222]|nr:M28 family peptidase [Kiritimatiellota bacterium B12222]